MDGLIGYVILILSIIILVIFLCIIFSKKYDKYKRGMVFSKFIFLYFLVFVILTDIYAIIGFGIHNFQRYFLGEIEGSGWNNVPPYMAHVVLLIVFIGYIISIWLNNKMIKIEEERKKLDEEKKEYYEKHMNE